MAATATPTILDPKAVIWYVDLLQSGDPPASFTEGADKYTGVASEAGSRIIECCVVNVTTTGAKLRVWLTKSGGSRVKIFQQTISPLFEPRPLYFLLNRVLNAGDIIEFASDTASALRIGMSVIEMEDS